MKVFQVVKRVYQTLSGDVDASIGVGTEIESIPKVDGVLGDQSIGVDSTSDGVSSIETQVGSGTDTDNLSLEVQSGSGGISTGIGLDLADPSNAIGTLGIPSTSLGTEIDTGTLAFDSQTGSVGLDTGTDTDTATTFNAVGTLGSPSTSTGNDALGLEVQAGSGSTDMGIGTDSTAPSNSVGTPTTPLGSDTDGVAATSTPIAISYATTVSGTGNWSSPTSAQGVQDGTSAQIVAAASPTSGEAVNGTLSVTAYGVGSVPASHTRTKVELVVQQKIDTTVGLLSSASCIINHKKSDGTGSFEVYRSEQATTSPVGDSNIRNDGSLVTDTYDITSAVSAWSDAEILASKTDFVALCNLLIITGGNYFWLVDSSYLRITYSRTGMT